MEPMTYIQYRNYIQNKRQINFSRGFGQIDAQLDRGFGLQPDRGLGQIERGLKQIDRQLGDQSLIEKEIMSEEILPQIIFNIFLLTSGFAIIKL